ncbi:MAG TPA: hypothetical protein VNX18_15130 [Bryobacteraceae bacterium]|nr:hypothetical protein [Bryobacteraceae bacterium]
MGLSTTSPDPIVYLMEGVVGVSIGAVIGLLVILVTKRPSRILVDAILGAVGFVGGAVATAYIPWRMNTVSQRVGDAIVSTTVRHYQHPYRAAFLAAVLLPVLNEVYWLKIHPLFRRPAA